MSDGTGTGAGAGPQREYRFYAGGREVTLEDFLAAVARRGEAVVETVADPAPAYKLTRKGRRAVKGEVA